MKRIYTCSVEFATHPDNGARPTRVSRWRGERSIDGIPRSLRAKMEISDRRKATNARCRSPTASHRLRQQLARASDGDKSREAGAFWMRQVGTQWQQTGE